MSRQRPKHTPNISLGEYFWAMSRYVDAGLEAHSHHYTREVLALMERLADFEDAASKADGEVK